MKLVCKLAETMGAAVGLEADRGRKRKASNASGLAGVSAGPSRKSATARAEDLRALQTRHPAFSAHAFRPGGILPDDGRRLLRLALAPIVVGAGELAKAMTEAAIDNRLFGKQPVFGNGDIKRLARHFLPERNDASGPSEKSRNKTIM